MISRVINVVCSIGLLVCLGVGTQQIQAQIGHNIRNGGGGAELKFARIWRSLETQFGACTHVVNPCDFKESERKLLSGLLKLKSECFRLVGFDSWTGSTLSRGACGETLTVNANLLYRGETAISDLEMSALALSILQQHACEGILNSSDFTAIVASASSLRYFTAIELGGSNYYVKSRANGSGDSASVRVNALDVDVNALLRSKYPNLPEQFSYSQIYGFSRDGKLDLRGEIPLQGGKISRFFISLHPDLDLKTAFVYLQ